MWKKFALAALAGVCGILWGGDANITVKGKEDLTGNVAKVKNIPGGIAFTNGVGYFQVLSKQKLTVDLKKKYQISLEYRLAPGSKPGCGFYFAPVAYDGKDRMISCESQNVVAGTDSVLAAPVKKGSRVVKVKDCAKWSAKHGTIAFEIKKDLSDLPNFNSCRIAEIKKGKDCWEVSLKNPVPKDYAAGTAVRNHRDGATYRYVVGYLRPQTEWKKASRIVQGAAREGERNFISAWRLGTVFAKTIIFPGAGKAEIEVRNISVTEVK